MSVYKIPAGNIEALTTRIEKLTRRARKLGKAIPVLTKVREYEEVVDVKRGTTRLYYDMELSAERISVNGWTFVAKVELGDTEVGLVIDRVPDVLVGVDIPAEYRKTTNYCSHCNKSVRRNNVYVVYNDETAEWKQIGRNCLGVFLGGVDPEDVLRSMETLINLDALCGAAQSADYFGFNQEDKLDLQNTLVFTAFSIKQLGWLSRSKARELAEGNPHIRATSSYIEEALFVKEKDQSQKVKELLADYEAIEDSEKQALETEVEIALDWIRSTDDEVNSDYLHNLRVTCFKPTFSRKHLGIVASLLAAYNYAHKTRETKPETKVLTHVGVVGQRNTFILTVFDIKYWQNNFGTTTAVFFNDEVGNIVIWKASRDPNLEKGVTYEVNAKVKQHTSYNNRPQTEISHAKVVAGVLK